MHKVKQRFMCVYLCDYVRGDTVLCTAAIEGDRIVKAVSVTPFPHVTPCDHADTCRR